MLVVLAVTCSTKAIFLVVVLMAWDLFFRFDPMRAVVVIVLYDLWLFDLRLGAHV
jgi:hypothetical protein